MIASYGSVILRLANHPGHFPSEDEDKFAAIHGHSLHSDDRLNRDAKQLPQGNQVIYRRGGLSFLPLIDCLGRIEAEIVLEVTDGEIMFNPEPLDPVACSYRIDDGEEEVFHVTKLSFPNRRIFAPWIYVKERSYDQYTVSFGRQGYGKDKTGIRVGAAEFRCISIKMRHRRIYIRHGGLFYVKATKGLNIFYMVFPCIKIIIQTHLWMEILIQSECGGNGEKNAI